MAMGHAEDIIGLIDQFGSEHAAAQMGDVDAQFFEGAHGMGTGWLALQRADSRRDDTAIRPSTRGVAEKPFGHRAATNIPSANKQNGFHSCDKAIKPCSQPRKTSTEKMRLSHFQAPMSF